MEKKKKFQRAKKIFAGAAAGTINGLLGAGGGLVLIPLFAKSLQMEKRQAFATSVAVVAPLCLLSAGIYFARGELPLDKAWPYLVGGLLGGLAGGALFQKIPTVWLERLLAAFMLYGGLRMVGIL